MKKIVYIVNVDWFFKSHRYPLALHAVEKGWDVYVLTKDTGLKKEFAGKGITLIDIPFGRTSVNPLQEIKCLLAICRELKRIKPDVIHNVTWKGCLWGGIAAKMVGNHHYAAFIFQNPDDIKWFKSLGYATDERIFLIKGSGIDLNAFTYKEAVQKDKLRVLFPARMLRDKGLIELIDAFKILYPKYKGQVELILAGSCADANKTAISEEELKGMLMDGYITWIGNQSDMYPVYCDSDIVVLPSYREGLPKALIEACAVGRPIVTTDVPGCRECADEGVNGYLVPLKSVNELAEAIEKLILSPVDRKMFGIASRKKAEEEFSIENVIEKTFAIYDYLLRQ